MSIIAATATIAIETFFRCRRQHLSYSIRVSHANSHIPLRSIVLLPFPCLTSSLPF